MEFLKLFGMLVAMFTLAIILALIEKHQGAIYHCTFWEQVRLNFAALAIGGCLVLLAISKG